MRRKIIHFEIAPVFLPTTPKTASFSVKTDNQNFMDCLQIDRLVLPPPLRTRYKAVIVDENLFISNKFKGIDSEEGDYDQVLEMFEGVSEWAVYHEEIHDPDHNSQQHSSFSSGLEQPFRRSKEEILQNEFAKEKNKFILGYKQFDEKQDGHGKGDYLFFSKVSIRKFVSKISRFSSHSDLFLSVDEFYQARNISLCWPLTEKLVSLLEPKFKEASECLEIETVQVSAQHLSVNDCPTSARPQFGILFVVSGNMAKIHRLFLEFWKMVSKCLSKCVEIHEKNFIEQRVKNCDAIVKGSVFQGQLIPLSNNTLLLFDQSLDCIELRNKFKSRKWILGAESFYEADLKTLDIENRVGELKEHMASKGVRYDSLKIEKDHIKISCDEQTKERFIKESMLLLESFIKEEEYCRNYDNYLMIKIFEKYFMKQVGETFGVTFQIVDNNLVRTNFTKYSTQIQEEMRVIREQIEKDILILASKVPIPEPNSLTDIFTQKKNPSWFKKEYLGCRVYSYKDIKIKLRPLESLHRKEPSLAFVIDDRLDESSIFHSIIKELKVNFNSFLADVHRSKKPERLRQYITEHSRYSHQTLFIHSGREGVSQTFKRDLDSMFTLMKDRMCFAIVKHQETFYNDVIRTFICELTTFAEKIDEDVIGIINPSKTEVHHIPKKINEVQFYFEGGKQTLEKLENLFYELKIRKVSSFHLQEMDIEKVYSLEQNTLALSTEQGVVKLSPLLAEVLKFEIPSVQISPINRNPRRFIFNCIPFEQEHRKHRSYEIVEFLICFKMQTVYRIHHRGVEQTYSKFPQIEKVKKIPVHLSKAIKTICEYFPNLSYTVLCHKNFIGKQEGQRQQFSESSSVEQSLQNQMKEHSQHNSSHVCVQSSAKKNDHSSELRKTQSTQEMSMSENFFICVEGTRTLTTVILNCQQAQILKVEGASEAVVFAEVLKCADVFEIRTFKEQMESIKHFIGK